MKRALAIALAGLIIVAFITTTGFAQTKAATTKSVTLTGQVVSNDGKMMTVKGPTGNQDFDVSGVKNVTKYKEGDQVMIKYMEKDGKMVASSISKPIMKGKMKKETTTTSEAPAPAPAK
jgi:hypothetical protein